jgi:4-aminobutyrate aminotransferase-like enzyme
VEDFSIKELANLIDLYGNDIAAVILEPIVSGGGFYFPSASFFQSVIGLCHDNDILFILDECQTGIARTGDWFYFQKLELNPDIVVTAKALGGGFPVSAVMMNSHTIGDDQFQMQYFSSHQNEPFAGSIVSFVLGEIERLDLLNSNSKKGAILRMSLEEVDIEEACISNIRGIGMMNAFDLVIPEKYSSIQFGDIFIQSCLEQGLLLQHCNFGKTIRLLPNYLISEEDIERLTGSLKKVVNNMRKYF